MSNNERHPNAWVRDLRNVADDALVKSLVEDFRHGIASSGGSMIPGQRPASTVTVVGSGKVSTPDVGPAYRAYVAPPEEPADRSGWRDSPQLKPPEGVALVDQLVDHQDKLDLIERVKQLGGTQALARAEAELKAQQQGLSHEEWSKLSEKDLADRKARQAKKAEDKK
jgi:hypothetical protein